MLVFKRLDGIDISCRVVGLCAEAADTFELVRQRSATPGVVPGLELESIARIFDAESLPPKN
jgi:hypothetical protein